MNYLIFKVGEEKYQELLDDIFRKNISSSFQKTITEIIISKIEKVLEFLNTKNISLKSTSIVGGVANNFYIKRNLENLFEKKNIELYYPIKEMMSDNAAMIAWACFVNYNKYKDNIFFKPQPRLKINERL